MQPTNGSSFAVMTYNILIGGTEGRIFATEAVIRSQAPDIVGIQEANDPAALRAMAARLGMTCIVGYSTSGYHVALLSRWPVRAWVNHSHPIFQKGLIEAIIDLPGEPQPWHIFVTHLTAEFFRGPAAERQRVNEIRVALAAMADLRAQGMPHLLMGDFNALAPGEPLNAVGLLARVVELDAARERSHEAMKGHPHLGYIIPPVLHPALPLIRRVPRTPWLARLFNLGAHLVLPRWTVPQLMQAGYTDCLRATYPRLSVPATCPLPEPAGRIDYLWADRTLAARLRGCTALVDGPDCPVNLASDHRPLVAQFTRVAETAPRPKAPELVAANH
jgi:endonuclease/exonuclease/phosphatase family metal-dependent hydrolase